jgi:hypothetical protein
MYWYCGHYSKLIFVISCQRWARLWLILCTILFNTKTIQYHCFFFYNKKGKTYYVTSFLKNIIISNLHPGQLPKWQVIWIPLMKASMWEKVNRKATVGLGAYLTSVSCYRCEWRRGSTRGPVLRPVALGLPTAEVEYLTGSPRAVNEGDALLGSSALPGHDSWGILPLEGGPLTSSSGCWGSDA